MRSAYFQSIHACRQHPHNVRQNRLVQTPANQLSWLQAVGAAVVEGRGSHFHFGRSLRQSDDPSIVSITMMRMEGGVSPSIPSSASSTTIPGRSTRTRVVAKICQADHLREHQDLCHIVPPRLSQFCVLQRLVWEDKCFIGGCKEPLGTRHYLGNRQRELLQTHQIRDLLLNSLCWFSCCDQLDECSCYMLWLHSLTFLLATTFLMNRLPYIPQAVPLANWEW